MAQQMPWEEYGGKTPAHEAAPASNAAPWEEYSQQAPSQPATAAPQPKQVAKPRTATERALRSVGLSIRPAVEAAGSTVGMIGDALNTAINMGGRAIGHNPQLGMPSQAIASGINRVLPQPETTTERVVNSLAAMGYGAMGADPIASGIQSRFKLPPSPYPQQLSPEEQTVRDAMQAGFKVPPSANPGAGKIARGAETAFGSDKLHRTAAAYNQDLANQIATREAGFPPNTPLTREVVTNALAATKPHYELVNRTPRFAGDYALKAGNEQQYAALNAIKDALSPKGGIDTEKLGQLLQSGERIPGDLNVVARLASAVPEATHSPPPPSSMLRYLHHLPYGVAPLLGSIFGTPATAVLATGAPLALAGGRAAGRAALLSGALQGTMQPSLAPGLVESMLNPAMRAAPTAMQQYGLYGQ